MVRPFARLPACGGWRAMARGVGSWRSRRRSTPSAALRAEFSPTPSSSCPLPLRMAEPTAASTRKAFLGSGRYLARLWQPSEASSPLNARPINDLWEEYRKTHDETIRDFLMEKYLPLVRYNAERVHKRLSAEVNIEDLMCAGVFGLMDAVDAFDLERKVKFETYCAPRIRGAILDELRSMDWLPNLARYRTAEFEVIRQQIEAETGHPADDAHIAARMGIPGDELRLKDIKGFLTNGLSRTERLILLLHYYDGMTLRDIGATLDLSESRVEQMHTSILLRLEAQLRGVGSEEAEQASSADGITPEETLLAAIFGRSRSGSLAADTTSSQPDADSCAVISHAAGCLDEARLRVDATTATIGRIEGRMSQLADLLAKGTSHVNH